jgi:formylglycine-generating enzyme required for sulfatase activity
MQALATGVALLGTIIIVLGFISWTKQQYFWETSYSLARIRPYVLSAADEQRLNAGDTFRECARDCPEMIVVPPGEFWMGSPDGQDENEHPRHKVKIDRPFAVGKYAVTWDEWDACVWTSACAENSHSDFGKGRQPVINVSWEDARQFVAWLSRITGKPYRLLSEAEWEYAARGITSADAPHPTYPWGDTASHEYANYREDQCCKGKIEGRDQWLNTAPVGQFPPNDFGLYDMVGNVWQWVEDRWHDDYSGAPQTAGCGRREEMNSTVLSAAAPSPPARSTFVRLPAIGTRYSFGAAGWAFGLRGRLPPSTSILRFESYQAAWSSL